MGPSVKFVLAIIDSISKKKWGLIFFPQNWTRRGDGRGPRASCLQPQNLLILIFEYFPQSCLTEDFLMHFLNALSTSQFPICRGNCIVYIIFLADINTFYICIKENRTFAWELQCVHYTFGRHKYILCKVFLDANVHTETHGLMADI